MQGTVTHIRNYGVVAAINGEPEVGDLFEVYRIHGGTEVVLGSGYVRKKKGEGFKINPMENEDGSRGAPFIGVQIGDLVRKIS